MYRDNTKKVNIGGRVIGGGSPVAIQSMTNTKTEDVAATVAQIKALSKAGCDIIRCAVYLFLQSPPWVVDPCRGQSHVFCKRDLI